MVARPVLARLRSRTPIQLLGPPSRCELSGVYDKEAQRLEIGKLVFRTLVCRAAVASLLDEALNGWSTAQAA